MTNWQLYMAAFLPTVVVLCGILINQVQTSGLREDIRMLTGKVIELTDRISHLEGSKA